MDVFDRILQDHEDIRRRFAEMREVAGRGDAGKEEALFRQQSDLLIAHHQTEEEVVFTQLVRNDATREIAEEAWEEHRVINAYLAHLRDAPRTVRPAAKVRVLEEVVVHHLDEEEDEMVPAARAGIAADVLAAMVEPFEEKEERRLDRLRRQAA